MYFRQEKVMFLIQNKIAHRSQNQKHIFLIKQNRVTKEAASPPQVPYTFFLVVFIESR